MSLPARPVLPHPLDDTTRGAWERAQALWGVHMADAEILPGAGEIQGAPAWFTFPPKVAVDPAFIERRGALSELESLFAHEIGHHVLAPATRIDALKIRHQLGRTLVAAGADELRESDLSLLSNLWTDLLVNTRVALLQRRAAGPADAGEPGILRSMRLLFAEGFSSTNRLWWVYRRTYELLWSLVPGSLCPAQPPARATKPLPPAPADDDLDLTGVPRPFIEKERALRAAQREAERAAEQLAQITTTRPELDASLMAEAVRAFAADPVAGALSFGVIAAPYLVEARHDDSAQGQAGPAGVVACAADDEGATGEEIGRILGDPRLRATLPSRIGGAAAQAEAEGVGAADGRADRAPARKGEGQSLDLAHTLELYPPQERDAVLAAWYRTEAARWVRPYTQRRPTPPDAELIGPVELWETGEDLADIDWPATLQVGGQVIPGVTTRRRSVLADDPPASEASLELDVVIDSSGSMRSPVDGSPAVLAGTILALSVLRGGGRVRVTSFSSPGMVGGSESFSRDPVRIVTDLCRYFGMGTTFPLDLLERRYRSLPDAALPGDVGSAAPRRHLVVLSDDGLVSMFGVDNEAYAHVPAAVRPKLTTACVVVQDRRRQVEKLAAQARYDVVYIDDMDDAPRVCAQLAEKLHG